MEDQETDLTKSKLISAIPSRMTFSVKLVISQQIYYPCPVIFLFLVVEMGRNCNFLKGGKPVWK